MTTSPEPGDDAALEAQLFKRSFHPLLARPQFLPLFGRASVVPHGDGSFEMAPEPGRDALWLSVYDRDGLVCDLVAWYPRRPGRWWLQRRLAHVLGEVEIAHAIFRERALMLYETPQSWLFAHIPGQGRWPAACVLDWTLDPFLVFDGVQALMCETKALAERMRACVQRHQRRLHVTLAPPLAPGSFDWWD